MFHVLDLADTGFIFRKKSWFFVEDYRVTRVLMFIGFYRCLHAKCLVLYKCGRAGLRPAHQMDLAGPYVWALDVPWALRYLSRVFLHVLLQPGLCDVIFKYYLASFLN